MSKTFSLISIAAWTSPSQQLMRIPWASSFLETSRGSWLLWIGSLCRERQDKSQEGTFTKNGHIPSYAGVRVEETTMIVETTVTDDKHDHFRHRRRRTGAGKAAMPPSETSSTSPTREYFAS